MVQWAFFQVNVCQLQFVQMTFVGSGILKIKKERSAGVLREGSTCQPVIETPQSLQALSPLGTRQGKWAD